MSLGPLVEQAIFSQIAGIAALALVAGIAIGAIAVILVRRKRTDR
jgi:uncharacterized membrane-anchored protein YhcB (DUF1043 family)